MEIFDCFVSYASGDYDAAIQIYRAFESAGLRTFLDRERLQLGDDWSPKIRFSACLAEVVVLVDSELSRRSIPVQQEAGMAVASGALIIPVSLDSRFDALPGWLNGIQGIDFSAADGLAASLKAIVDRAKEFVQPRLLAASPGRADSARSLVLRILLQDQFNAPSETEGAWSRQYNRYLHAYWGPERVRPDVSQGASLTLTGLIVERLIKFREFADPGERSSVDDALQIAEQFILASQESKKGFGRLSPQKPIRGPRKIQLDLRHSSWAVRALLAMDADRFRPFIEPALDWLLWNIPRREASESWCWTTAPLIALLNDERALAYAPWARRRAKLLRQVEHDLKHDFHGGYRSWVIGETGIKRWVATDNALYVLYTLAGVKVKSATLRSQIEAALQQLAAKLRPRGRDALGLPMFSGTPEVGPTAHLLSILADGYKDSKAVLAVELTKMGRFVVRGLAEPIIMPLTFPWHLSGVLTTPSIRDCGLNPAPEACG
jgi:TIR domain